MTFLLATCLASLAHANTEAAEFSSPNNKRIDNQPVFVRKPVWELGLGVAYFSGHDYPASNDPNQAGLALPFFIYRSEVVRVEGRGVGAVAYERPTLKLDVALGGSLNAESEGNAARAGMPDLDFLFEIGPRLNALLFRRVHTDGGTSTLRWLNSVSAVASSDFSSLDGRGFLVKSELEFRRKRLFGSGFDFQLQLDSIWASQELHDYFYSVDPEFETTDRSSFTAESGYLSSTFTLGFGYKPTPALRLFAAINFENFQGAANEASPLFETDNNINFAVALVWTVRSSKQQIDVFEDD